MDHDESQTGKQAVAELNAALPRKVWLADNSTGILGGALSFIVVGAILLAVCYHMDATQIRERGVLRSQGQDVPGEVTAEGMSRSGVSIHYTFKVDGQSYQGAAFLPDRPMNLSVGEQIPIRYLPSDPSVSHPGEWEWSEDAGDIGLLIFMQLFPGLGAVVLVVLYRQRELARKGWVVEGKVTGCSPNRTRFRVSYEFQDDKGALIEGSNSYADEYDYGAPILVIYWRAKPARNDCYPVSSFRSA